MQVGSTRTLRVDTLASATSSMMVATDVASAATETMMWMYVVVVLPVRLHLWLSIVCLSRRLPLLHLLLLRGCKITLTNIASTTTRLLSLILT